MTSNVVLGVFPDVAGAAQGVQSLLAASFPAHSIDVLSGVPYPDEAFGLPPQQSNLTKIAPVAWIIGAICGFTLVAGSAWLSRLPLAAKPIVALPAAGVITYELAMLFGVVVTAFFTLREMRLPDWRKSPYHYRVAEGWLAVTVQCRDAMAATGAIAALKSAGAEEVTRHG
ncbi:MAG: DUF3341 domain-containing protein [Cyanobacteria bacterium NC_groundwater_1444_Ag_S-0.65um_54_12]|nr:DUF3341 domain-containing protein [Cyanobacteria bacterium NC_groundwater_1444_Ag_S-0.65um_54_12]